MLNASERAIGQFPLSIATSLAFEGAIGIHPDQPNTGVKLSDFKEVWVNARTLFRNFYNAIGRENYDMVDMADVVSQYIAEMSTIEQLVADHTNKQAKVIFYVSDYIGLDKANPAAVLRVDSTEKQVAYSKALGKVVSMVMAQPEAPKIKVYKNKIYDENAAKILMLTNFAYDLTNKNLRNLFLLESHTGLIKSRNQFYTKYYNGKDLPMIPFREDLLSIFGDSELFRPISATYRNGFKETATKYSWNYSTTTARMRQCLDFMPDKMMSAKLKSFLRG